MAENMVKERDEESGQFTETVSDDELVAFVYDRGGVATADVAEAFDFRRPSAYRRLRGLEGDGRVTAREIGNSLLWEAVDDPGEPDERERRETPVDAFDADRDRSPTPDDGAGQGEQEVPASDDVRAVVDGVAAGRIAPDDPKSGWADDHRLDDRKAAARAVLQHALDTGEYVGRADAVEQFRDAHPVEEQDAETWWRANVRVVLSAVGDHMPGKGYRVDPERVAEAAAGERP